MFEKNEWWIILGAILLGVYYYVKKYGSSAQGAVPGGSTGFFGSLVNPTHEMGVMTPAQTTRPIPYTPAQPFAGSNMIRIGTFQYVPGPAQTIPVTRLSTYRLA